MRPLKFGGLGRMLFFCKDVQSLLYTCKFTQAIMHTHRYICSILYVYMYNIHVCVGTKFYPFGQGQVKCSLTMMGL